MITLNIRLSFLVYLSSHQFLKLYQQDLYQEFLYICYDILGQYINLY